MDEQGNTRRESVKAGVMLTGLVPASQTQADLFDSQNREKTKRLMSALDAVNDRWGGRYPPVCVERD